jgi:rhodanese-related sulfurtransferase
MSFVKNIVGGAVIMIIATIVGVAHNAVRSKPIRGGLFPRIAASSSTQSSATTTPDGEISASESATAPSSSELSPEITASEFASGEISMERVRLILESGSVTIVDARSEAEFADGHLPGAVNIPFDQFVDYIDTIDSSIPIDAPIICYCRSVTCDLSDQLAQELRLMGYENVVVYRGGWDEWTDAKLPTLPERGE